MVTGVAYLCEEGQGVGSSNHSVSSADFWEVYMYVNNYYDRNKY